MILDSNTPSAGRRIVYSSGETEVIAGADMKFALGSSINGNLTYNPDFATIEADQEVVNLTRYETFYGEKRLFFLEGADLFRNNITVFYSRRIGNLDFGVKSNGWVGKYEYALISAKERASAGNVSSHTSVFRLQRDVLASSNIGLLAVDREFSGGYNRVLSSDATFQMPANVSISAQFAGSFPSQGKTTKAFYFNTRQNHLSQALRNK